MHDDHQTMCKIGKFQSAPGREAGRCVAAGVHALAFALVSIRARP